MLTTSIKFFSRYSQPMRVIFTLGFLFLFCLIWYLFLYQNLNAYIDQISQEVTQLASQDLVQQNIAANQKTNSSSRQNYAHYSQLCKNKLLELCGSWAHERAVWVIDCLENNQVTLTKCKPIGAAKNNKELYFLFYTQSEFTALSNFFSSVCLSPYLIECLRCDIKKINDTLVASKFLLKFSIVSKS